jgi:CheY-like chemotaxis protein
MAQILVVDDETAVRGALVAHLGEMGHRCREVENGIEALEALHEREFDLILTDVAMPRMNGLQFLERALPYLEGRVPVVLLSSVDDREAIAAAMRAGAFDYLTKPAGPNEVRRIIEEGLTQRSEVLRLHGRRNGRGGPVPREALGEAKRDRPESQMGQASAGLPAFQKAKSKVLVSPPEEMGSRKPPSRGLSLLARFKRWFGPRVA